MKLSCEKKNSANGKIAATLPKESIEKKSKEIAKNIAKTAKIDGFRAGKVPAAVIAKRYGEKIEDDAKQAVVADMLTEGLKELGIEQKDIVGQPVLSKFEEKDGEIDAEISFSMRPTIAFEKIEELVPDFDEPDVDEKAVEERLKTIAQSSAPLEKYEGKRGAKAGDFLTVDFVGTIDGKEFDGGKAENMKVELGAQRFLPDFEKNLEKMKIGEEKVFDVAFPADYGNADLAGKTAQFSAKVLGIETKADVVLDDELAKRMMPQDSDATIEKFKTLVKEELTREKRSELISNELKPKLIETLLETYSFDLPELIVEQEIDLMVRGKVQAMKEDELKALQEDANKAKEFRESTRPEAEKSVKATFIIDELARIENVVVNDNELMTAIYYEAMGVGAEPKAMLEYYQKQGLLPAIKMAMVEDKLLNHLITKKKGA